MHRSSPQQWVRVTEGFPFRATAVLVLISVFAVASRHGVLEDALIYARFVANLFAGHGLVFNPGEPVNALTSPLFTYLLIAMTWLLHGRVLLAGDVLFTLTFAGACLLAENLAPFSGILAAVTAYFYSVIGMETSTLLLVLMLVVTVYQKRKYEWLPLLVAIAVLTRFEAGLLVPIVAWKLWRERRFPRMIAFLPAIALLFVYVLLNRHFYGAWLPNSATSKLAQARSGLWGQWPWSFLQIGGWAFGHGGLFRQTWWMVPPVLVLAVLGWGKQRGSRPEQLLTPFALALMAFYILFNIPSYHWYYAPFVFLLCIYAMWGLPQTRVAHVVVVLCVVICIALNFREMRRPLATADYVNIAEWINRNTPSNATIEASEIGTLGWYTHRPVIDILGLTNPKNSDHIAHKDVTSWLSEDRPAYIVVHHPLWVWEKVTENSPDYEQVPFHSGNVYLLKRINPDR
ncbi:MAG TPA: hypothetical protein VGU25_10190 [Acidobacteriaceae bacterium]|nr:hypothetical protein [Acidobacteriaceae bacterium]